MTPRSSGGGAGPWDPGLSCSSSPKEQQRSRSKRHPPTLGSPLTHYLGSATQVCTREHVLLFCQGEDSGCCLNSAGERSQPWDEECPAGGAGTTTGRRTVIISGRNQRYQRTTQILMEYHKVDIEQTRPSQGLFYKQIVNNLALLIPESDGDKMNMYILYIQKYLAKKNIIEKNNR